MNPDTVDNILVAHYPGFRSSHLRRIRESLGSIGEAVHCHSDKLKLPGFSESLVSDFISWRSDVNREQIFQILRRFQIQVIFRLDAEYPELLKQCSDPPEVLFVRGEIPQGEKIAFVGSRKYSSYGQTCVSLLIPDAVACGVVTISGLALGIDGLVHKKTIDSGGRTIAVLGTGIDSPSVYPRAHSWLSDRILETGGALISEFPPGTPGRKEHFPMRNRIIAGMSRATVVIEAGERSGSLITARLALEENRDVFAVPGPITRSSSAGTNNLLRSGATPCLNFASVIDGLSLDPQSMAEQYRAELPLSHEERQILERLTMEQTADELAESLCKDIRALGSQLTALELRGIVNRSDSGRWIRVSGLP